MRPGTRVLSLLLLFCLLLLPSAGSAESLPTEGEQLIITNLQVGKADAAVLQWGDHAGMIDAGSDQSFQVIQSFLEENGIHALDFLLLTHFDRDHVGSAPALIRSYPIAHIYLPDYESEKKFYTAVMQAVLGRDRVITVREAMDFTEGRFTMRIFPADNPAPLLKSSSNRDNNMSLISLVSFGECRFLFTGDIEKKRIRQILKSGDDLRADWIKYPHHGEYEEVQREFLERVNPASAVVSTSLDRPISDDLLMLLNELNIRLHSTVEGHVTTLCDGTHITVESVQ